MIIKQKTALIWEVLGVIFIIIVGAALHFTYELSNNNFFIGFFSAVNESIWEHLKLGFFASIIFCFLEYPSIKDCINNYFIAKFIGATFMILFIVSSVYLFKNFSFGNKFYFHITIYVLGSILSQIISYKILILNRTYTKFNVISLYFIIIYIILFFYFTNNPPIHPLFKNPQEIKADLVSINEKRFL